MKPTDRIQIATWFDEDLDLEAEDKPRRQRKEPIVENPSTMPTEASPEPEADQPTPPPDSRGRARKRTHKSPQRGHKKAVINHMHANLGLHQTIAEVTEAVAPKFSPQPTEMQIGQSLSTLANQGLISRVGAGVYVYRATDPTPVPQNGTQSTSPGMPSYHVYETVGHLEDGTPVVRSDDGVIYLITSLDRYFGRKGGE